MYKSSGWNSTQKILNTRQLLLVTRIEQSCESLKPYSPAVLKHYSVSITWQAALSPSSLILQVWVEPKGLHL